MNTREVRSAIAAAKMRLPVEKAIDVAADDLWMANRKALLSLVIDEDVVAGIKNVEAMPKMIVATAKWIRAYKRAVESVVYATIGD